MSNQKYDLITTLKETLSEDKRFIDENGELIKASITSASMQLDSKFINLLLSNEMIKKTFFTEIDNTLVFDKVKFNWVVNNKQFLPDSYTRYKNKIGLSTNDYNLITENNDVSLVFPYKDSILEGGQTSEEEQKDEIFYNEVLAAEQIRNLLSPKALTNAKKYTVNGEETVSNIDKTDNLIIKGNNLLALSSLLENYRNKVKLIYIDPPYNTGNDSFSYNDKFNHSSWLTFIKSRLEICQDLLKEDGCIYISIDENEYAYLKVLMDEIFGEDNDLITFHMQVRYTNKSLNEKNDFQPVMEYGIFYAKNKQRFVPNKPYEEYDVSKFRFAIKELGTPDETVTLGGKKVEIFKPGNYKINKVSPSIKGLKETWASGSVLKGNTSGKFFDQFLSKRKGEDGLKVLYKVYGIGEDGLGFRYFTGPKKATSIRGKFYSGIPLNKLKQIKTGEARKYKPIVNYYDFSGAVGNIRQEGGVSLNGGKKPEKMLNMLLNISTNKGDIVLDPFSGSGTTAAVCLKTGRKFVAIEQIDNQIELIKARLVNCINGDKTGLSKAVDWQGGGSFIYVELKELNEKYVNMVRKATELNELKTIYKELKDNGLLIPSLETRVLENEEYFNGLTFEEQKEVVLLAIDKNKLYVNSSQIDDEEIDLNDYEKELTLNFYGKDSSNDTRQGTLSI